MMERVFLSAVGLDIAVWRTEMKKEDVLMKNDESCVLLHKHFPFSVEKGSKHVHARYFFVVDKMENKEVKIAYCPTEKMVANYSSKPLQGKLLVIHRNTM